MWKTGAIILLGLAFGACANITSITPLERAVGAYEPFYEKEGSADLAQVKQLVESGADVNAPGMFGFTALHSAANFGTREIVEYLVSKGANVNANAYKDRRRSTPLILAAGRATNPKLAVEQFAIVEFLIENGANVNFYAECCGSPLTAAAYSGKYRTVEYLLRRGADLQRFGGEAYVSAATGMAEVLKHDKAGEQRRDNDLEPDKVLYEHISIMELLVSKGVNVNSTAGNMRSNALHAAAALGNPRVVRYLLSAGVDPTARRTEQPRSARGVAEGRLEASRDPQLATAPMGFSQEIWDRKMMRGADQILGLEQTIAILARAEGSVAASSAASDRAGASIAANSSQPAAGTASTAGGSDNGLLERAGGALVDCAKLKASYYLCDKLPFPLSSGCRGIAKAQFDNVACKFVGRLGASRNPMVCVFKRTETMYGGVAGPLTSAPTTVQFMAWSIETLGGA
jgi:ankyrin repeat protein